MEQAIQNALGQAMSKEEEDDIGVGTIEASAQKAIENTILRPWIRRQR
jgi:hypothetical protein